MNLTDLIFSLIDFRSFSNLWYWIALAVTWSTTSHWILGVPYDLVLRARRRGGEVEADFHDILRVNVNRLLFIGQEAGVLLTALGAFAVTTLAILGFFYRIELCQALFLLLAPLGIVAALSIRTAAGIRRDGTQGEALYHRLHWHRVQVQIIGVISIFVTAMWGMLQNFTISPFG